MNLKESQFHIWKRTSKKRKRKFD